MTSFVGMIRLLLSHVFEIAGVN